MRRAKKAATRRDVCRLEIIGTPDQYQINQLKLALARFAVLAASKKVTKLVDLRNCSGDAQKQLEIAVARLNEQYEVDGFVPFLLIESP